MNEYEQPPAGLLFMRSTPDCVMARPPLFSSLQSLESSFLLLAIHRLPHSLVTCAAAIESAMKAALDPAPRKDSTAEKLYERAAATFPTLASFTVQDLTEFRKFRNHIVHYGFSPKDDETSAVLLLKTGYPYLIALCDAAFGFSIFKILFVEFGDQLRNAFAAYSKARTDPSLKHSYCFRLFTHQVKWSIRKSFSTEWEDAATGRAEDGWVKFEASRKRKSEIEKQFSNSWTFHCPICGDVDTLVCELDDERLNEGAIFLKRAVCASCDLVVPSGCPYLTDLLCRSVVDEHKAEILKQFGVDGSS